MKRGEATSWLFIRDLDERTWAQTPGAGIVASLGGQPVQEGFMPGLLFHFHRVTDAARAALRCHAELPRFLPGQSVPPMVLDFSQDPKPLAVIAHRMVPPMLAATRTAVSFLAAEPVERAPGPQVLLDNGQTAVTELLLVTSHNLGWALPLLPVSSARVPDSRREPAVINIQMGDKHKNSMWLFRMPWKWVMLLTFAAVALVIAQRATRAILGKARAPVTNTEAQLEPVEYVPTPTLTPIPPGFGAVLIRTTPADARIYLDDEFMGKKSPVALDHQSNQKTYKVTVKRKGYESYTAIFNVQTGETKILDIELQKR